MTFLTTPGWSDYFLIDSGKGFRLEQFGNYTLKRPDPGAIWETSEGKDIWDKAQASFIDVRGKGKWVEVIKMPEKWLMQWEDLSFYAKLAPFKHTGVFPEQILQWQFIKDRIKSVKQNVNILNLFGYTGIATLVSANSGASVTHVDASKPTLAWARENQAVSNLQSKPIRWILDDAVKFTAREVHRGVRYDGIILDPPVYGHGPDGEIWDFNKSFSELLGLLRQVLSPIPLFVVVNAYAVSASSLMLENVMQDFAKDLGGKIESGELGIQQKNGKRSLSTGIFSRWYR